MKTITVNQIEKVLDSYLEGYLNGERAQGNVIFMGEPCIGKSAVIRRWLDKNKDKITPRAGASAQPLWDEKNGILTKATKNGEYIYLIADTFFDDLNRENSVVHYDRFNYGLRDETLEILTPLIRERKYVAYSGDERKIDNLFLFIAEMWDPARENLKARALPAELMECFDVYYVEPSVAELMDYLLDNLASEIDEYERSDPEYADSLKSNLALWSHIFASGKFKFIFEPNDYFTPVDAEALVRYAYNKQSLLEVMDGRFTKATKMLEEILEDYSD